jgi:hypothetical protein
LRRDSGLGPFELLPRPLGPLRYLVRNLLRFIAYVACRIGHAIGSVVDTLTSAFRWTFLLTSC